VSAHYLPTNHPEVVADGAEAASADEEGSEEEGTRSPSEMSMDARAAGRRRPRVRRRLDVTLSNGLEGGREM
jgi:hypothetical protein